MFQRQWERHQTNKWAKTISDGDKCCEDNTTGQWNKEWREDGRPLGGGEISFETWQEGAHHMEIHGDVCSKSATATARVPRWECLRDVPSGQGDMRCGWQRKKAPQETKISLPLCLPTSNCPSFGNTVPKVARPHVWNSVTAQRAWTSLAFPLFYSPQIPSGSSHFHTDTLKDLYPIPPGNII